ncbi:asparagine synthase (glutamine-hydrolysing) [Dyadobacter sp. SG02]|nr:asparagine synthase (glutamine-hydrolysing) [Dyadobacter sp. SG02]
MLSVGAGYNATLRKLILFRSIFGNLPLFYIHIPHRFVLFSTSLSGIISHKLVREQYLNLDLKRIQTHLDVGQTETLTHSVNTFYSFIKLVPPGHIVEFNESSVKIEKLTTFRLSRWDNVLKTTHDVTDAFFSLFKQAVELSAGSTSSTPIATHLSGGLDSSSVSAMLRYIQPDRVLHTIHNKSKFADSDESAYAIAVSDKINSVHHEVYQSEEDFELIRLLTAAHGQPIATKMPPTLITSMLLYAKDRGCEVLLSGSGGDSIVGSGFEIFQHAFETRDWALLENLLEKRAPYFSYSHMYSDWDNLSSEKKVDLVKQFYFYNRVVRQKHKGVSQVVKTYLDLARNTDLSHSYFLKRAWTSLMNRANKPSVSGTLNIAAHDLIEASNSKQQPSFNYPASLADSLGSTAANLFTDVFNPTINRSQEGFFDLGNHIGISSRSPLQNKALLELCMAVPDTVKYGNGLGREHFRNSMRHLLPEVVVNRPGKATLTSAYGQEITFRLWNQAKEEFMESTNIWSFIDRKKFLGEIAILENEQIPYTQKSNTWCHVTRAVTLHTWLEWMSSSGYPISY